MSPSIFSVENNINLFRSKNDSDYFSDTLRYFFVIRKTENQNNISFSVFLKNNSDLIIDKVWFSAFVGIPNIKFAPGLDEQNNFLFKESNLGGAHYLSGYTKDHICFVPESPMEILYFEIPLSSLSKAGSLEFNFGCESVGKTSFRASWSKGEIQDNLSNIDDQSFIKFLNYKNHKTIWRKIYIIFNVIRRSCKRNIKNIKGLFYKQLDN